MKSEYIATEVAYNNGFAAALDEMSLCVAICTACSGLPHLRALKQQESIAAASAIALHVA